MDVTINILGIGGIVVLAMVIGYLLGNYHRREFLQEGERETTVWERTQGESRPSDDRHRKNGGRRIMFGKSIASPVAGEVGFFSDGNRRGVMIEPEHGMVYAPVSGKITKLYPMGNAFLLQTDEQGESVELLIRVGRRQPDELCSMYYRPRIVQNEIVNKGKLLLEFDKELLQAVGEEATVTVSLENGLDINDVSVTQKEHVKVGDDLMWIGNREMAFTV